MNILDLIIPRLYDIAITMGIISICYALWTQGKYYGENLTMEEKPIKIILENYNNEKITFTMPSDATVESMIELDSRTMLINRVHIDAKADDITIKKEEFTGLNQ